MAIHANSTTAPDDVEASLQTAFAHMRHGRYIAALRALEAALARCADGRCDRIERVLHSLGSAPIASLAMGG